MEVAIVGEDQVTQGILLRLLNDYRPDLIVKDKLPARGGQIKNFAPRYNKLDSPVLLLTDLDSYDCPPALIRDWFDEEFSDKFLFRIACDEAESWLMSDREGFARWLSIDLNLMPNRSIIDRRKNIFEVVFQYKPSLYMMKVLVPHSTKENLKDALSPREGASKGPGYNTALMPFIEGIWNVENAASNSFSLRKAIDRIKSFQVIV